MTDAIKPYITVATNYSDPINKGKYVYSYTTLNKAQDFTLSYYSETQDQIIKYTAQQASIDQTKSNAAANDNQRIHDVEKIAQALGIYSDSPYRPEQRTGPRIPGGRPIQSRSHPPILDRNPD